VCEFPRQVLEAAPSAMIFRIGVLTGAMAPLLERLSQLASQNHFDFAALTKSLADAQAAIASYRVFATLKRDGIVPGHCRFQVSLPTPIAPISAFVARDDQSAVEPIYEARMLEEVALIVKAIPADQLAIQWDTNVEFAMLEGVMPAWFDDVRAGIIERLLRLSRHVPAVVELG
jgi:hypothetical protein